MAICCIEEASHCHGLSCCRAQGAVLLALGLLEHRLSTCASKAYFLHVRWDLPRPGINPMSLAFAGGFFTTEPPGKPSI